MGGEPRAEVRGACMCGRVAFRIKGPLRPVLFCHCDECRISSGHYVAATGARREHIVFDTDAGLRWYASSDFARRGFCADCGSNLFFDRHASEVLSIMAGVLRDADGLRGHSHWHSHAAGSYYTIDDGLPCYEGDGPTPEF